LLIGLKGYKGVGKDTVADYYVERYDFVKVAFADKMKEAVANLFGIPIHWVDEYKNPELHAWVGLSGGDADELGSRIKRSMDWREFLQRFGTEMGRNTFGQNFWVKQLLYSERVLSLEHVVISDCRFANEAQAIRQAGGKIMEIVRPGYESDGHPSEQPLPTELIDFRIQNSGDLHHLLASAKTVLEKIRGL